MAPLCDAPWRCQPGEPPRAGSPALALAHSSELKLGQFEVALADPDLVTRCHDQYPSSNDCDRLRDGHVASPVCLRAPWRAIPSPPLAAAATQTPGAQANADDGATTVTLDSVWEAASTAAARLGVRHAAPTPAPASCLRLPSCSSVARARACPWRSHEHRAGARARSAQPARVWTNVRFAAGRGRGGLRSRASASLRRGGGRGRARRF